MTLDEREQKIDKAIFIAYEVLERNKEKEGVEKAFSEIQQLVESRKERNV